MVLTRVLDTTVGKDISTIGRNADTESKDNIHRGKEEYEHKKSGSIALPGGVAAIVKDNTT